MKLMPRASSIQIDRKKRGNKSSFLTFILTYKNLNQTTRTMGRQPYVTPVHKRTVVGASVTRRILYITILVAIILLVALWAWKALETNEYRKNAETEQNDLQTEGE